MFKKASLGVLAAAIGVMVSGCAYQGEGIDNPVARRAVWFSFLAGDDMAQSCRAGSPEQVRAVYNGVWREQVRIYELGFTGANVLDQRVIGANELTLVSLDDPQAIWRGKVGKTTLTPEQASALTAALEQNGAFGPTVTGQHIASDGYYWTVAACHQGRFTFNAWQYPNPDFAALTFPAQLLAADKTGIAFNPARKWDSYEIANKQRDDRERWYIDTKPNGLVGAGSR